MLREENVVSSKFIKLIEPPYVLHLTVLSVQKMKEQVLNMSLRLVGGLGKLLAG